MWVALTRDGISTNENGNARKRSATAADARASARAGTLCAEGESIGRVFQTMGLVAGLGYFLIALGPALTLFVSAIAPRPFLILAVLARSVSIFCVSLPPSCSSFGVFEFLFRFRFRGRSICAHLNCEFLDFEDYILGLLVWLGEAVSVSVFRDVDSFFF